MIEMHPVESSAIRAIGHDRLTGTIHVEFRSGGVHPFGPFTANEFQEFRNAKSKGKHFHAVIRKKAMQ